MGHLPNYSSFGRQVGGGVSGTRGGAVRGIQAECSNPEQIRGQGSRGHGWRPLLPK